MKYNIISSTKIGNIIRTNIYKLFDTSSFSNICNRGYKFGYGALFIVSKKNILKHSKQFWEKLYTGMQLINPPTGQGLEKLWPLILI